MPRRKNWRRAETRKMEWTERSRTDYDGETTDKYVESPSNRGTGRPSNVGHRLNRQKKTGK